MILSAVPFHAIELTQAQAEAAVKYGLPIAIFLFIVWYVFSAAKRSGRKF